MNYFKKFISFVLRMWFVRIFFFLQNYFIFTQERGSKTIPRFNPLEKPYNFECWITWGQTVKILLRFFSTHQFKFHIHMILSTNFDDFFVWWLTFWFVLSFFNSVLIKSFLVIMFFERISYQFITLSPSKLKKYFKASSNLIKLQIKNSILLLSWFIQTNYNKVWSFYIILIIFKDFVLLSKLTYVTLSIVLISKFIRSS